MCTLAFNESHFIGISAFSDAWFWMYLKNNDPATVKFMRDNYPPNFTYQGPML